MKNISHRISVPAILEIGQGNLCKMGNLIAKAELYNIVIIWDKGIKGLFGDEIVDCFSKSPAKIIKIYEHDNINIGDIVNLAFDIPNHTEAVIGIGGGKVLDVAKYVCFLTKIPFISVPTSTSNDGFSSSGCSLLINGKRTSVSAKMPYGIIVDLDIVKNAPVRFIYSGIGDVLSKFTAIYDWYFEEQHNKTKVDDFAAMIAKKAANSFIKIDFKSIKEECFLEELIDSLTLSGISMEIAENSAPASGSEHLISHALDKFVENPSLHGIQVGVATYIMSAVQNNMKMEVEEFFKKTGFFEYVKSLKMKKADFKRAIDEAADIKPHRYTFLHIKENRQLANKFLETDYIINDILI